MVLQALAGAACLFAGVLQLAAYRSPDTSNLQIVNSARRLSAVALLVAGIYILYSLSTFGYANTVLCLISGMMALSQTLFAMHTFFTPACTNRLMGLTSEGKRREGNYS